MAPDLPVGGNAGPGAIRSRRQPWGCFVSGCARYPDSLSGSDTSSRLAAIPSQPPVHLVASTAMQGRKRRAEAQLAGYISENFWPARVTPSNSVEVLPASKPSFPFWSDF